MSGCAATSPPRREASPASSTGEDEVTDRPGVLHGELKLSLPALRRLLRGEPARWLAFSVGIEVTDGE